MAKITIPLIGSMIEADVTHSYSSKASMRGQNFRNCIFRYSQNAISGGSKIEVRPLTAFGQYWRTGPSPAALGSALMQWTGKGDGDNVVSAFGATNSTIYEDGTSRGSITGKVIWFSETMVTTTATFLALADNGRAWYYPDGGALTEITDTDFPTKQTPALTPTGNFVHMDGYAFIACTNGQIWNSDLNSVSGWTANNYVSAAGKPDGLIGLAKKGDYIYAFGTLSCDVYYNAGNATGSPLSPVKGASFSIGALNQYCILPFRDSVVWVGVSAEGGIGVYILVGESPKKISTGLVDNFISASLELKLHTIIDQGKQIIFLGYHGAGESSGYGYIYDPELNIWSSALFSNNFEINQTIILRTSNGAMYTVAVNDDYGALQSNLLVTYQTAIALIGPIGEGEAHTIKSIQVLGDGFGTTTGLTVSIAVNHSDDIASWTSERDVTTKTGIAHRFGYAKSGRTRIRLSWTGDSNTVNDAWLNAVRVDIEQARAFA